MKKEDLRRGMGLGGWLTNYKRFAVLPKEYRYTITLGDEEHFDRYITEKDVAYIASKGFDHVRLAFDQVVMEELKALNDVAYVRFASVYREIKDVDTFLREIEKIAKKKDHVGK